MGVAVFAGIACFVVGLPRGVAVFAAIWPLRVDRVGMSRGSSLASLASAIGDERKCSRKGLGGTSRQGGTKGTRAANGSRGIATGAAPRATSPGRTRARSPTHSVHRRGQLYKRPSAQNGWWTYNSAELPRHRPANLRHGEHDHPAEHHPRREEAPPRLPLSQHLRPQEDADQDANLAHRGHVVDRRTRERNQHEKIGERT